jgi:3'-phosphoadenosine 5'-phosphosulfate sulfotransferase (PAPS reductase)/FAD synthetase
LPPIRPKLKTRKGKTVEPITSRGGEPLFIRDESNILHVVALSGGHDSTALAFLLREKYPDRPFNYICTPTGNELPAMFDHWMHIGKRLGRRLVPIMAGTLHGIIRQEKMLPNFRVRFCTRRLKIEPYRKFLREQAAIGPIISYVGLRADEEGRAGGAYSDIAGVEMRFPLREWGFSEAEVQAALRRFGIACPNRTDCGDCYHQRLGEWFEYWRDHREAATTAVALEREIGGTFRTPGRDAWPVSLSALFAEFEKGRIPTVSLGRMTRERMEAGGCRVCSL